MTAPLILGLATLAWCALHSLLIAPCATDRLRARLGGAWRWHRVVYNLVAALTLLPLLAYERSVAASDFWSWPGPWTALRLALLAAGGALLLAGARHYDLRRFLGLRQLRERTAGGGIGAAGGLDTRGVLGLVRHPWYLGGLLVLWSRNLDWSALLTNAIFSAYLVLGSLLEERKLAAEFGAEYRAYRRRVPMLIPWPRPRSRGGGG